MCDNTMYNMRKMLKNYASVLPRKNEIIFLALSMYEEIFQK